MLYTMRSSTAQFFTNTFASTLMIRDPAAPHHLPLTHTQVGILPRFGPAS
jgi:hypothetical protein